MAAGEGGGGDIGADSERRLQKAMDKLYHFPKPKSSSTGGSKPSSSTSAPSSGRAVGKAAAEAARRFGVVRGSRLPHQMLAMAAISPPPPCRPWDRADLMRRLGSFKAMTWFAKPKVISPVNCARRGWTNIEPDVITCEACGARLLFSTPSSWTTQQVEKAAAVFSLKLDSGHKLLCPWIDNICDESLALFPPTPPPVLVGNYYELLSSLLRLLALPRISCSSLETMKKRNPQLEQFLSEPFSSSVVLKGGLMLTEDSTIKDLDDAFQDADTYYQQALKIISLCGWEPRLLPYAVDCGTEFHSDANSTSKLAQPEQSSKTMEDRDNGHANIVSGVGHSKDANISFNFTIAGGPPPTRQSFRPKVSFPVVSRHLKADLNSRVNLLSSRSDCYMVPVASHASGSMKRKRSTDEPHLLEGDADDVDTSTIGANHDQPGENSEKSISNLVVSTEQKQDGSHSNAAKDTELDEASNETQPETGSPLRKSITSTYADADQHGLEPRFCSVQGTNEEPSGGVTLTEMHANNSRSTEKNKGCMTE
uniref:C3HC-type domain-containing protein n=1 Tax=Zea mays TaxID=4577 RepID=A0A804QW09_MAIZE